MEEIKKEEEIRKPELTTAEIRAKLRFATGLLKEIYDNGREAFIKAVHEIEREQGVHAGTQAMSIMGGYTRFSEARKMDEMMEEIKKAIKPILDAKFGESSTEDLQILTQGFSPSVEDN